MNPCKREWPVKTQRGAASLIVVMVLFFLVSLTAAYTSRNLIFEQKTSANQARSTLAFEAAEAGVEWALAQLNGGLINTAACSNDTPTQSFQQRYLNFAANGFISQKTRAGGSLSHKLWPTCVFNGVDWTCVCPDAADLSPGGSTGTGPFPAFRVWPAVPEPMTPGASPWIAPTVARPGFLPLYSVGCTRLPSATGDNCLNYLPEGELGDGLAALRVMLALRSGLPVPPAAAVTARLTVTPAATQTLKVVNTDAGSSGFTVNTGGTANKLLFAAESVPGTPGEASFVDGDMRLAALATTAAPTTPPAAPALTEGERMFVSTFSMKKEQYRQQPGLRVCAAPCSAANITALLANNPNRIIWVDGPLTLNASIGDPASAPPAPVLLIVDGDSLTLSPGVSVYGFVYLTGGASSTATINLPDAATQIRGALVAEGALATNYSSGSPPAGSELTVTYDRPALDRLRDTYGSWVRLGGGWRDFKANPS